MNRWTTAEALKWADNFGATEDEAPTGNQIALDALAREVRRLRTALEQCDHQTHALRVWDGQQWTYHPPQAGRIAEICKARMELAPNVAIERRP